MKKKHTIPAHTRHYDIHHYMTPTFYKNLNINEKRKTATIHSDKNATLAPWGVTTLHMTAILGLPDHRKLKVRRKPQNLKPRVDQ